MPFKTKNKIYINEDNTKNILFKSCVKHND